LSKSSYRNSNFYKKYLGSAFKKKQKKEENFETYSSNVEIEANKIALDITKEEKEYLKIKERKLFLFYS